MRWRAPECRSFGITRDMEVASVDAVHVLQIALGGCRADICDAGVIEPIEIGDEDAEECEVLVLVVINLVAEIDALGNQGSQVVIARGQVMGTADAAGVCQQCSTDLGKD